MALSLFPSRSVLSGGLAGIAAWGLVMAAQQYGITIGGQPVSQEFAYLVASTIGGVVTHFVPDTLRDHAKALNLKVENLAALMPQTYDQYPTGKNGEQSDVVKSIQGWKDK